MPNTKVEVSVPPVWKLAIFTALVFAIFSVLISTLVKGPEGPMGPIGEPGENTITDLSGLQDTVQQIKQTTTNFSHILYSQKTFWDQMELGSEAKAFAEYLDETIGEGGTWFQNKLDTGTFHLWNIFWWLGNSFWDRTFDFVTPLTEWITRYANSLDNNSLSQERITWLKTYLKDNSDNGGLFDAIYNVAEEAFIVGAKKANIGATFGENQQPDHAWIINKTLNDEGDKFEIEHCNGAELAIAYSSALHIGRFNYEITISNINFSDDNGWVGLVSYNTTQTGDDDFDTEGLELESFGSLIGMQFAGSDNDENVKYYPSSYNPSNIQKEDVQNIKFGIQDNVLTLYIQQTDQNELTKRMTINDISDIPQTVYIVIFDNNPQASEFTFDITANIVSINN